MRRLFRALNSSFVLPGLISISAALPSFAADWTLHTYDNGFDPSPAGSTVTYQVPVTNASSSASTATPIQFEIPIGTTFVDVTGGATNCSAPVVQGNMQIINCTLPPMQPADKLDLEMHVLIPTEGVYTVNTVIDPNGANISAPETTTIQAGADLEILLSGSPNGKSGATYPITATVTNHGPNTSNGSTATFELPSGIAAPATLPTGCTISGQTVTCIRSALLPPGESYSITLNTQIIEAEAGTIDVSATISPKPSGGLGALEPGDPIITNNNAQIEIEIEPSTDVSIGKTRSGNLPLFVGDRVTFTIQPEFAGLVPTEAEIRDSLPSNYRITNVTAGGGWSCSNSQTVSCLYSGTAGDAAAYKAPIIIEAEVIRETQAIGAPPSSVENTATITSPVDENPDNNTGKDGGVTILTPYVDLDAEKSGPALGLATVGNSYDWKLSSYNKGSKPFWGPLTYTDTIPAGLRVDAVNAPSGWSCVPSKPLPATGPMTIICDTDNYTESAPLNIGQYTPAITVTATVQSEGLLTNRLRVDSDNYNFPDINMGNNEDTTGTTAGQGVNISDLRLEKSVIGTGPFASGSVVRFAVDLINDGPRTAEMIEMTDRLSNLYVEQSGQVSAMVSVQGTPAPACTIAASSDYHNDLKCTLASLPPCGQTNQPSCPRVIIDAVVGSEGPQENTAVLYSTATPDPILSNNTDSAAYVVTPRTDLTITKRSDPAAGVDVPAGKIIEYRLTASVVRTGLSGADDVVVTDHLPANMRFESVTSGPFTCAAPTNMAPGNITTANSKLVCTLARLNHGQTVAPIRIKMVPLMALVGSTITNSAQIDSSTPDINMINNEDDLSHSIVDPIYDLVVNKEILNDPVQVGENATFRIQVTNNGPSEAFDVVLKDLLPDEILTYVSHNTGTSGFVCAGVAANAMGGTLTCDLDHLPAGETVSLDVVLNATIRGEVTNWAEVEAAGPEATLGNNRSGVNATVRDLVDVAIVKTGPSPAIVDLRENFNWVLQVSASGAPGYGLAESVVVTDDLPPNMILTGTPKVSGGLTGACSANSGKTRFTCSLGHLPAGTTGIITVPVRMNTVSANPATVTNTAKITTASFDQVSSNNSSQATVQVQSTRITGRIYVDFAEDGIFGGDGDYGLSNRQLTLTGTDINGATITRTTRTDASGNYTFAYLPEGNYRISYSTTALSAGIVAHAARPFIGHPGTGQADSRTAIIAISPQIASPVSNQDFTLSTTPTIDLTKSGSTLSSSNGVYELRYTFDIRNRSLEPLTAVSLTDTLTAGFGSVTTANPPAPNQFVILSATSTNPAWTTNAAFDGSAQTQLGTFSTLAPNASARVILTLKVAPPAPLNAGPLVFTNDSTASGNGAYSAKSVSAQDDHSISAVVSPQITLVKSTNYLPPTAPLTPKAGDPVSYDFVITNTGDVALTSVTLTDSLIDAGDITYSPAIGTLLPGQSTAAGQVRATYLLTQADIDAGEVENIATASGIWQTGTPPVTATDDVTINGLKQPGLEIIKEFGSDTLTTPPQVPAPGDTDNHIRYRFLVRNSGNVVVNNVVMTDSLPQLVADPPGSFAIGTMDPGEEVVLWGNYPINQDDIERGNVVNTSSVSGEHGPTGTPISANSEDIIVPLAAAPGLKVTKLSNTASLPETPKPGDIITWTVTIENTGNTRIRIKDIDDLLAGASVTAPVKTVLAAGETTTATASYALTQADINSGQIRNQVIAAAEVPGHPPIPVPDTPSGNGTDSPTPEKTVTPLNQRPGIELVKTANTSAITTPAEVGQQITYSFSLRNTGNVDLRDVEVKDPLPGITPASFTLASLPVGDTVVIAGNATYTLTQSDLDAGMVTNRATVTGNYGPPEAPKTVEDASVTDAGVDGPTVVTLAKQPSIRLVKALTKGLDPTRLKLGDPITWTFCVTNTGSVTLTDVIVTEKLAGAKVTGGPITLAPGATDTTTFTASYRVTQADIDAGQIVNSATTTGTYVDGTNPPQKVTDISGTSVNDDVPTVTPLAQKASIALIKAADTSALSNPTRLGDKVTYSFTVINTGTVSLSNIVVTDPLAGLKMTGQPIPSLKPGASNSTNYTAIYSLTQADIDLGKVENIASATGTYTDITTGEPAEVTDISGADPTLDAPLIIPLHRKPALELVKTVDSSALSEPPIAGENLVYSFAITNSGNVTMTNVTVVDLMPGLILQNAPIASLAPGETNSQITGTYALTAADLELAELVNTAHAKGEWSDGLRSPLSESLPSTVLAPLGYPDIEFNITISEQRDLDGNGILGAGDKVVYRFEVINTGTVALHGVDLNYQSLSLSMPNLICTPISLEPGQSAFLECRGAEYTITAADVARGTIDLTGKAEGTAASGTLVDDPSKAPTVTGLGQGGLTLTKTAGVETAMVGDVISYTITASNDAKGLAVSSRINDLLPAGFIYRTGSARLNGQEVMPDISGRNLSVTPVQLRPGESAQLTLSVLVTSSVQPGTHVNHARLLSSTTGRDIAPEATAVVRIRAEAVFQCASVIGRVFDDRDQNGHMSEAQEERGLPSVRLLAPNGTTISTDEHGRFNVPCAALPQAVGSNFMLKLDERTLPAGYRLTTENPRVVRLTPGMITRLDFGATMARLVRIDLAHNAFAQGKPTAALQAGLQKLVNQIKGEATMLRISYVLSGTEDLHEARRKLRSTETALRDLWKGIGKYKLSIETIIEPVGAAK